MISMLISAAAVAVCCGSVIRKEIKKKTDGVRSTVFFLYTKNQHTDIIKAYLIVSGMQKNTKKGS